MKFNATSDKWTNGISDIVVTDQRPDVLEGTVYHEGIRYYRHISSFSPRPLEAVTTLSGVGYDSPYGFILGGGEKAPPDITFGEPSPTWKIFDESGTFVANWTISSCLLYTSPSPRDATLSRMPSSA